MTRTSTHQSETLIFANDRPTSLDDDLYQWSFDTEELIRRHHARITKLEDVADMAIKRIAELESQLSAIDAAIAPSNTEITGGFQQSACIDGLEQSHKGSRDGQAN